MKKRYYLIAVIGMLVFGAITCRNTEIAEQAAIEAEAVETIASQNAIEDVVELSMADN